MLRFLTAGESHGRALMAILDGMPAGMPIDLHKLNYELWLRQQGYGRSARQKIEHDQVEITGGIRHGITTGAPIGLLIKNLDWQNWKHIMAVEANENLSADALEQIAKKAIKKFRPGHADLAGTLKFRQGDIRDVLERASARETAARVAVGAICLQLLDKLGVTILAHVIQVGNVKAKSIPDNVSLKQFVEQLVHSEMFCIDVQAEEMMKNQIKQAALEGDSVGGVVEVVACGLPPGLGTYTQWDGRLDGKLAQALISIPAIKAIEIGDAVIGASLLGSQVHDPIIESSRANDNYCLPFQRTSNHAGGIEGGMTNGENLKIRAYMKPIPTLRKGLPSLSYPEFKSDLAHFERSDVCAISAASVVCKAMVAFVLSAAIVDKFGGDTMTDLQISLQEYMKHCQSPSGYGKNESTVKIPIGRANKQSDMEATE